MSLEKSTNYWNHLTNKKSILRTIFNLILSINIVEICESATVDDLPIISERRRGHIRPSPYKIQTPPASYKAELQVIAQSKAKSPDELRQLTVGKRYQTLEALTLNWTCLEMSTLRFGLSTMIELQLNFCERPGAGSLNMLRAITIWLTQCPIDVIDAIESEYMEEFYGKPIPVVTASQLNTLLTAMPLNASDHQQEVALNQVSFAISQAFNSIDDDKVVWFVKMVKKLRASGVPKN
jgi:hypothetical protein